MTEERILRKEGVYDYDYSNDILFFKVKDREYSHSVELLDYVVDLDTDGFIVGVQIFDASKYFDITKEGLRDVKSWKMDAAIRKGVLEVKLVFSLIVRNMTIEKSPILVQPLGESISDSRMLCTV